MDALFLPEWKSYLRYLDLPGSEPAVVFVPGSYLAGTGAFVPTATEPGLAERRRVIIDLLGGGFSDRPQSFGYSIEEHQETVATLLDTLGLTGSAIVGHSIGGAVAIELAAKRPGLVERLFLAEANLDAGGGFLTRFVTGYSEEQYVASGHADLLTDLEERAAAGDDPVAPIALGLFRMAAPHALHRCSVGAVRGTNPVMRELLYQMTIPRIYVFGEWSLPDEDYEVLSAHGVPVAIVPDAGHGMTADNPVALAKLISGFLDS